MWALLVGAALMTLHFSVVHYTLRNPSRVRLERAFAGAKQSRRLAGLERHMDELLLATAIVRAACHLLMILVLFRGLGSPAQWPGMLGSLALALSAVAVLGIGVPHAWAKYAGERTVAVLWPVLVATRYVLWPVNRVLTAMDLPIRRLSGHREQGNGRTTDVEQEILQLASEGQAEGGLDADELEMISSVIEFHDIRVSEIMTPRTDIEGLPADASLDQCVATILRIGHSRIPVYEGTLDSVIGVLYAKDLLGMDPARPFDLRTVMRNPLFVPETKGISVLLKEFRAQKAHMAIVLDEYGGTAGLATIEDLLEEIVGEIADEYEQGEAEMLRRLDGRTVEVDARIRIDDLNDELDIQLPEEEDYDTAGGFVFSTLGYIPKAGDEFDHAGIHFTVVEAEERKITRIHIRLPEKVQAEEEE